MGLHLRATETPLWDRYGRGRGPQDLLRLPADVLDALEAEFERTLHASWRGLLPPPEAHSMVLPYPLGITEPRGTCTQRHHDVWDAAKATHRFNNWFYRHRTSPRAVAERQQPALRATTLVDHLVGKAVMQHALLLEWEAACAGVRDIGDPDPLVYCWRNKFYRWPDVPMTVAGQQANFSYPAFLAIRTVEAMYAYGEECYCRVIAWVDDLWSYHRTGQPEFHQVVIGRWPAIGGAPIQMLDAFHRKYWQDDPDGLRAQIVVDPGRAVATYLVWHMARLYSDERPPGYGRDSHAPPRWALRL